MAVQGISWSGVLIRIALSVALVIATFNPSGTSLFHWLTAPPLGITAEKAFAGVALLIAWFVCLRNAYVALGTIGLVLAGLLLGTFVWVLFDLRILESTSNTMLIWIGLVLLGVVLGFGLSWGLLRARATGQIDVH
jgi:hypothetical protein